MSLYIYIYMCIDLFVHLFMYMLLLLLLLPSASWGPTLLPPTLPSARPPGHPWLRTRSVSIISIFEFPFESLKSEQLNCGCFLDTMSDFNVPGSRPKKNDEISKIDRAGADFVRSVNPPIQHAARSEGEQKLCDYAISDYTIHGRGEAGVAKCGWGSYLKDSIGPLLDSRHTSQALCTRTNVLHREMGVC